MKYIKEENLTIKYRKRPYSIMGKFRRIYGQVI